MISDRQSHLQIPKFPSKKHQTSLRLAKRRADFKTSHAEMKRGKFKLSD